MVKVKNKVLIALSVLLCAVLLSGVFVFAKPQTESGIEVKAESTTLTDEQITQRRANPGLYETNSMNFVKNSNGQDYTWQQMIDEGIVTTTNGNLQVNTSGNSFSSITASNYVSGDLIVGEISGLKSLNRAFNYMNIETLDLYNLDTTEVTDMSQITFMCREIKHLYWNTETFITNNVTTMSYMFAGFYGFEDELDISHFDMTNVTDVRGMFSACSTSNIKLPTQFVTNKMTSLIDMFSSCEKLKTINLSGFDTSNVTTMASMFKGCASLTGLVFPANFVTSNVKQMSSMFEGCSNLENISLDTFNTSKVNTFASMFADCTKLRSVGEIIFDTTSARSAAFEEMFSNCTSLTKIKLGCTVKKSCSLYGIFYDCKSLREIDLSELKNTMFDTEDMFTGCTSLVKVVLPETFNEDATIVLPTITELSVSKADHYGYVGDNNEVVSITTDGATTITSEMEGKTIELYDSENNSLVAIAPTEPATGVNASVIAIVCSIVAVLMIVIAYGVISNKKNSKRKINAINIDNNKIK